MEQELIELELNDKVRDGLQRIFDENENAGINAENWLNILYESDNIAFMSLVEIFTHDWEFKEKYAPKDTDDLNDPANFNVLDNDDTNIRKNFGLPEVVEFFLEEPADIAEYVMTKHPCLKFYEKLYERRKKLIKQPTENIVGVFVCPVSWCRSKNTYIKQVQTKSGDEGADNFIVCLNCGSMNKM